MKSYWGMVSIKSKWHRRSSAHFVLSLCVVVAIEPGVFPPQRSPGEEIEGFFTPIPLKWAVVFFFSGGLFLGGWHEGWVPSKKHPFNNQRSSGLQSSFKPSPADRFSWMIFIQKNMSLRLFLIYWLDPNVFLPNWLLVLRNRPFWWKQDSQQDTRLKGQWTLG